MMERIGPTRRGLLLGATGALAMPAIRARAASGRVVVRSLGGAYQDAMAAAIHKPFTAATGIEVVSIPSTAAQVLAMVKAGHVQLDVMDAGSTTQIALQGSGALADIDYAGFKLTNPADIHDNVRTPTMVGNLFFATVMVYDTRTYSAAHHPKSWAEFWDAKTFPGARTLADQSSGAAELEFALLADGVAKDKIYPVDLDRAFASLSRIRPAIVKWWQTGAQSAELMENKDAVLGGLWNGRAQDLIDKGAPLAIEWNEAKRQVQALSIVKNAPNAANAQRFVDFALQPRVQADIATRIAYGPTNKQAMQYVPAAAAQKLPSENAHYASGFDQDAAWWGANLAKVGTRWQAWVLGG
jgi:putative spermidine/putrescine transport system substrate-binding protein